jgi:hypothetical protein
MTAGPATTGLQTGTEREARRNWLIEHGVPHFTGHYSAGVRARLLTVPLFAILAYQLGAATWFEELPATQLFFAPLVPVAMALAATRWFLAPLGLGPSQPARWWRLPAALLVPAFAVLVVTGFTSYGQADPSLWLSPHPWIDFAVIFMSLLTAAVLLSPHEWGSSPRGVDHRWAIFGVVTTALAFFALEGAAFPYVSDGLSAEFWAWLPGLPAIPRALPALIVMAMILARSLHAAGGQATVVPVAPQTGGVDASLALRALPFMLVALGLDTALLRDYTHGWWSAASPFIALLCLLGLFVVYRWLPRRPKSLWFWLAIFVVAYPSWALAMGPPAIMALGRLREGLGAVATIVIINLIYVVLAYVVVEWGLDRIGLSAYRGAKANARDWSASAAQGLPLLLGITALSLHTAEFWEISAEVRMPKFFGFLAVLVAPVVVALLALSVHDIRAQRTAAAQANTGTAAARGLTRNEWINGLLIAGAFNSLVFVGLAIFSFAFFRILADLTVPPDVAAEWVYGDGQQELGPELQRLRAVESPWTRVPLTLTAFSVLYVFVSVMTSQRQRDDFFGWVRTELRQRFDARLEYQAADGRAGEAAGEPAGTGGASAA